MPPWQGGGEQRNAGESTSSLNVNHCTLKCFPNASKPSTPKTHVGTKNDLIHRHFLWFHKLHLKRKKWGHSASYVPWAYPIKPCINKTGQFYDGTSRSKCIWLKNMRNKTSVAVCSLQFACANEDHLLLDSCLIDELKCDVANLIAQVLMWAEKFIILPCYFWNLLVP